MTTSNKLNSDSPIAFFDSGIGGLTVLNKVLFITVTLFICLMEKKQKSSF